MDYSLSIYDVAGRHIRRHTGSAGPGEISVVWDAGVYFFEARAGEFTEIRRMVLCK